RARVHHVHPDRGAGEPPGGRAAQRTHPDPRRKVLAMSTNIEEPNPGLKDLGRYEYGWADSDAAGATARRGLSEEVVRDISARKDEPEWMTRLRLKALRLFDKKPMPTWGSDLTGID